MSASMAETMINQVRFAAFNRWRGIAAALVGLVVVGVSQEGSGDDFRRKTKFWAQLNAPMTAVVDGMPLRDALRRISQPVGINLCLDRQVDPTSPVIAGSVGPTIYMAMKSIAAQRDCVVMPVCNVLLVGRPEWVDTTAGTLLATPLEKTPSNDRHQEPFEISWPDLTTPHEALAESTGAEVTRVRDNRLPHDLWPQQAWKQIDRGIATALILAQCDLQLAGPLTESNGRIALEAITLVESVERMYSSDLKPSLLRQAIMAQDPSSRTVVDDDILLIKASAGAHRLATDALLTEFSKTVSSNSNDDTRRFSMSRTETSAGAALTQFAHASGRQCVIESEALAACRQRITLEAKDETLKSLINRVAKKADVTVEWHDKKIVVTTNRP